MANKLSVAIITLNEERIIEKTLSGIKDIADEIIIVDSNSTDKTVEIAKSYGAQVFVEDWKGYSDQKNSALEKCKCDWILSLDADEYVTKDLSNEISGVVNSADSAGGYKVARKLFIGNKPIVKGGYFPDYQLRLIKKNTNARFVSRRVHESIKLDGEVRYLKNPLDHYAYACIDDYRKALKKYAKLASEEMGGKKFYMPAIRASWTFFYRYLIRLGFLDGKEGLDMAKAYKSYVFEKYKLAEQKQYN